MQPILSIVIPVYNVKDYLVECIESIIKQNIERYEVILINDGSTDGSEVICNEYANEYEQITVIHKKNSGQSAARNSGIDIASGKYIAFLDSDDYYNENKLKSIISIINTEEPDIIINKVNLFYENKDIIKSKCNYKEISNVNGLSGEEAFVYLVNTRQFLVSPYSYIIKKEILENSNLRFDESKRYAEDIPFAIELYFNCKKVWAIDEFLVMYRKGRKGQLTSSTNIERDDIVMNILSELFNAKNSFDITKDTQEVLTKYIANTYIGYIGNQYLYDKTLTVQRKKIFSRGEFLIEYSTERRLIGSNLVYKIFGFDIYVDYISVLKKIYRRAKRVKW